MCTEQHNYVSFKIEFPSVPIFFSCFIYWNNEHFVISGDQLSHYFGLGHGYPNVDEIHHINFSKCHDMFGFNAHGGAKSNSTFRVTSIIKDGAADKDGRLRVRNIYL